jgi:hypothetical protein
MTLWWIGNVVLIVVVIPVVAVLLHRLVKPVLRIGSHIQEIHGQAVGVVGALDQVGALVGTRDRVKRVCAGLARYVNAVDRVL